jgi:ribonuclease BN (tRNA processing enzyme)
VPNNSHLILSETILLLDCGYSVPNQLWKYNADPSFIDAIYITHGHADHYFGIPALLVRLWEERRTKPLRIICHRDLKEAIQELIEYGYKGLIEKFKFKIDFKEAEAQQTIVLNELRLEFAPTIHAIKNLAIKVSDGKNAVCYSGDGMFNEETERLYRDSDLVIHEAYSLDQNIPAHASVNDLIDMAHRNHIKCLALTHLQRDLRRRGIAEIRARISKEGLKIIIPEPFEEYLF